MIRGPVCLFLFFKLWRDVAGFVKPLSLWIVALQHLWVCTILGQSSCAAVQPYSSARCGRSSVSFNNWFFNQLQVRVLGILFASIWQLKVNNFKYWKSSTHQKSCYFLIIQPNVQCWCILHASSSLCWQPTSLVKS